MVMNMQKFLILLRQAVAQAIATQKGVERKCLQGETTADRVRAQAALVQGDEMLARQAWARWQPYSETARALGQQMGEQTTVVGKLRQGLQALEQKIAWLRHAARSGASQKGFVYCPGSLCQSLFANP